MSRLISRFGGKPLVAPAMRELPLQENIHALQFGRQLLAGKVDMLILLTGVGTRLLIDIWKTTFPLSKIVEALSRLTLLTRGPKSALAIKEFGLTSDLTVPEPNTWHDLLTKLDSAYPQGLGGMVIGVQEYGISNPDLLHALKHRGAVISRIPVYRWGLPEDLKPLNHALTAILESTIEVLLFTNAAQIDHIIQLLDTNKQTEQFLQVMKHTVVGSIGRITSDRLRSHGLPVDLEPSHPKMGILVKEISEQAQTILRHKRQTGASLQSPSP